MTPNLFSFIWSVQKEYVGVFFVCFLTNTSRQLIVLKTSVQVQCCFTSTDHKDHWESRRTTSTFTQLQNTENFCFWLCSVEYHGNACVTIDHRPSFRPLFWNFTLHCSMWMNASTRTTPLFQLLSVGAEGELSSWVPLYKPVWSLYSSSC